MFVQAGSWVNEEVPRTVRVIVPIDHVVDSIAFTRVSPCSPDGQVDRWHEPSPVAGVPHEPRQDAVLGGLTPGPRCQTT